MFHSVVFSSFSKNIFTKQILSLLSTLCCPFLGVFSMLTNFKSRQLKESGDIKEAKIKAFISNILACFAIFCGFAILLTLFAYGLIWLRDYPRFIPRVCPEFYSKKWNGKNYFVSCEKLLNKPNSKKKFWLIASI